jgi:hypothetical protein
MGCFTASFYSPRIARILFRTSIVSIPASATMSMPATNCYPSSKRHTKRSPVASVSLLPTLLLRKKKKNCIFFHIHYNSLDPDRQHIQNLFRTCILEPNGEETLPYIRNHSDCYCDITRLVVAYHKQRNLKNLLFPRRFREITNRHVSSFFPPLDDAPQEQP